MARDCAPDHRPAGRVDGHEDDPDYQRSPQGELEARTFWALPLYSPERDEWLGGRPMPHWYYRYL